MSDIPFFSVVIPLYNKADFISACLTSVLNQNFDDYEIIIVNDGSTDKSALIVENFFTPKIKLFHQDNLGVSTARNYASQQAKGTFLAFLDADDVWKPNHLQSLKNSIDLFPNAGLYGNNYEIKYNNTIIKPASLNIKYDKAPFIIDDFFKASLKDTIIWTSAAAISRKGFMSYGQFNNLYTTGQDLDLWIRIALKENIVFNPEITMVYNKGITNSLSKSEYNEVRYRLFNSFKYFELENDSLKKYLDIKRYGLALRTKINGENKIYRDTLKSIDFNNLNFKQRVLLKTPSFILQILNLLRPIIISNSFYLSVLKR